MWVAWIMVLLFGFTQGQSKLDPLVNTPQGLIRGLRASDGDYSMFLGIPYARVNEDNPFGSATPQPRFDEIFDAYDDSAVCPQIEEFRNTIVGTLDCLRLNVYVPSQASIQNRLPVIIWIHGGSFIFGFGNRYQFGPKFLVRHGVILVSINYRLGPYGFMCLDTPDVPGNQGLKDQVLAMRWVMNNIAAFGGDVNKITLMGGSAGASSIEYHLHSNQEVLYNKLILQSGSSATGWSIGDSNVTAPLTIADHLGFQTEDISDAIEFLKNIGTNLVIAAVSELGLAFRICVEKEFDGVESFLTNYPNSVNLPKVRNIPVLIGYNNREMLMMFANMPASYFRNLNVFNDFLRSVFDYDDDFVDMVDLVRRFYIGDEEMSEELKSSIIDFSSDIRYNYPVQRSMAKLLKNGARDVFHYVFSYSGQRNFVKQRLNITDDGASHADELGYLFDYFDKSTPSPDDQRTIDQITTLWTNFAKYGDPTPDTTELLPVKWTPATRDTYHYLDIDKELTMKKRPYHARLTFWELFYKLNEEKMKGHGGN